MNIKEKIKMSKSKRRLCFWMFTILILSGCSKNDEALQNTEAVQRESEDTVRGNSGKRYVMSDKKTENTQTEENFGDYSELQRILREIANQTKQAD